MPYELSAKCPCRACTTEAHKNLNEIERLFGFRDMGDGRKIPQSYCRKCRSAGCEAGNPKCTKIKP